MKVFKLLLSLPLLGLAPVALFSLSSCNEPVDNTVWSADGSNWKGHIDGTINCVVTDDELHEGYAGYAVVNPQTKTGSNYPTVGYWAENLEIPEYVVKDGKKYQVTKIGNGAFYKDSHFDSGQIKGLTGKIKLPGSLQEIGEYAFYCCIYLNGKLEIPNSVTKIKDSAFAGDVNQYMCFTSLQLSNSLIELCKYAFYRGTGFRGSLVIPSTLTTIGESAFATTRFDGSLTIPNSVTTINQNVFLDTSFTSLYLQGWMNCGKDSATGHYTWGNAFAKWVETGTHYIHVPVTSSITKNSFPESEQGNVKSLRDNPAWDVQYDLNNS